MAGQRGSTAPHYLTMPLDELWRLSAHPWAVAVVAGALAAALGVGLLLPQVPADVAADPQSLARWLADLRMRHGPWIVWAERAGVLWIHATLGFRLLWAAAGFLTVVAAADRGLAWWNARSDDAPPWHLVAHLGLVVLLLAAVVQQRWAVTDERTLLAGAPASLPAGAGTLYLEPLEPWEDTATIRWQEGEQEAEALLYVGQPRLLRGRTLHLTQTGLAVRLRLTHSSGLVIPLDDPSTGGRLQAETLLRFGRQGESRYVSVPQREWLIRVACGPAAMQDSPAALWVYRGWDTTPLAQGRLSAAGELQVGEYRLRWEVLPYAQVRIARNPGLLPGLAGWLLLCVGMAVAAVREARVELARAAGQQRLLGVPGKAVAAVVLGGGAAVGAAALQGAWEWTAPAMAALTCLGGAAGLLVAGTALDLRRGWRRRASVRVGPWALSLGLLLWTLGGGLIALIGWAASGSLWCWSPGQGVWGLVWCVLLGAWHLRQSDERRLRLPWPVLVALLVTLAALLGGTAMVAA